MGLNHTTPGRRKYGSHVRTWYELLARCLALSWPKLANIDSLLLLAVCSAAHLERIRSVERDEISPEENTVRSEEHIGSAQSESAEHRVFRVLPFCHLWAAFVKWCRPGHIRRFS